MLTANAVMSKRRDIGVACIGLLRRPGCLREIPWPCSPRLAAGVPRRGSLGRRAAPPLHTSASVDALRDHARAVDGCTAYASPALSARAGKLTNASRFRPVGSCPTGTTMTTMPFLCLKWGLRGDDGNQVATMPTCKESRDARSRVRQIVPVFVRALSGRIA
jgi:hypothetical protein